MARRPALVQHLYLAVVVLIGWVLFRSPDLGYAGTYLRALVGFGAPAGVYEASLLLDSVVACALVVGAIGSMPWLPRLVEQLESWAVSGEHPRLRLALQSAGNLALALIFLLSAMELSAGTYNPFIYFRF